MFLLSKIEEEPNTEIFLLPSVFPTLLWENNCMLSCVVAVRKYMLGEDGGFQKTVQFN